MARHKSSGSAGDTRDGGAARTLDSLIKTLPGLATQTIARAAEQSGNLLEKLLRAPEYMEQTGKAGRYLKDLRQVAGLTLEDLAKAVDIENLDLLRAIEEGRSPVTLDILFRLASFYSRNDPFTFMLDFSKEYAPWLWQFLRFTGVEKLLITVERELKFINIYRSRDSARKLNNEDYDRVVAFMHNAFGMALDLIEPRAKTADQEKPHRTPSSSRSRPSTPKAAGKPAKARSAPARKSPARSTKARK